MSEPQLILDYASPRKRGKVRLPATSRMDVFHDAQGTVWVVETLSGQLPASMAIAFGLFVACAATLGAVRETTWILNHRHQAIDFILPTFMAALALTELVLIVFVIRQTWRTTTLTADARQVTLTFAAPLMRTCRRAWPKEEIGEVVLVPTQSESDAVRLAELRLRPSGLLINLFTDHREMDLEAIARKLNRAMAGAPPEVESLRAMPVLTPAIPPPDPQTLERLRGKRQELHDRLH